jgi:hypothetical protein
MPGVTESIAPRNQLGRRAIAFLVAAAGALLLGVGALLEWVTLSFPGEIDPEGLTATPVPGVDIWEGKVVLGSAVAILGLLVATRVVRSGGGGIAIAITAIALVAAGVAVTATILADTRFIAGDGLDAFAAALSEDLGVPVQEIRDVLEREASRVLEVERGIGLWLSTAGGLLAAAGGVLTFGWIRRRDRSAELSEAAYLTGAS